MVESDVRHRVDDLLAPELQHHAEDAVNARVVGAEVQEEEIGRFLVPFHAPLLGPEPERLLLGALLVLVEAVEAHLGRSRGMVLAQRMALPRWGQEDAAQVRMAGEGDAEHVPGFALVPVGVGPEVGDGGNAGGVALQRHLDADVLVPVEGHEMVDEREVAGRLAVAMRAQALVDDGQVEQHPEGRLGFRLEEFQQAAKAAAVAPQRRDAVGRRLDREGAVSEPLGELAQDRWRQIGGGGCFDHRHPVTRCPEAAGRFGGAAGRA